MAFFEFAGVSILAMNFEEILNQAVDITDRFDLDLGGLPDDVLRHSIGVKPHISFLRNYMLQHVLLPDDNYRDGTQALLNMHEWSQRFGGLIAQALEAGSVAAVDGTPIIHHQRFLTGQVYACAIGVITAQDPLSLDAMLVKVEATNEAILDTPSLDAIKRIIEQSTQADTSTSWPIAFMEYQERKRALELKSAFVIIDGPIVTQNLLTRDAGRRLFREMFADGRKKRYVGVIKDLHKSDKELRWHGLALREGELYVWDNLAGMIGGRYEDSGVIDFANGVGKDILRGVYRPGRKTFGFECHRDDLAEVVALLWLDQNNHVAYEIPFLLAQVDAQIRGRYRPSETMKAIESTLAGNQTDAYFDTIDERDLR